MRRICYYLSSFASTIIRESLTFCVSTVSRFVKYTGYGNAAGLLAARGLMAGGQTEGEYSEDEDTDTEEYKEAKPK